MVVNERVYPPPLVRRVEVDQSKKFQPPAWHQETKIAAPELTDELYKRINEKYGTKLKPIF